MTTELLLLKWLDHPNILNIFEIYQDNDCYYLVCELMEGGELYDEISARIEANLAFTELETAKILVQVLSAV